MARRHNDNGRFLESCATNGLTNMNVFEHKDTHKYTWECRGGSLHIFIDYFAVRKALRPTVADVKVIRGAEAGSDHYLFLMKVNIRWSRRKKVMRKWTETEETDVLGGKSEVPDRAREVFLRKLVTTWVKM